MKNTKRRIEPLSFYDHNGISRHFEKMAACLNLCPDADFLQRKRESGAD